MYIRIYKEKKSATQSCFGGDKWILEVVPCVQNSFRGDPMAWNATKDTHNQIKLKFDNYEAAVEYASSHGMEITDYGKDSGDIKPRKKSYLDNFQA